MYRSALGVIALAAALLAPSSSHRDAPVPTAFAAPTEVALDARQDTQDEELSLGRHMQRMKRHLRRLKRSWDKEDGGVAARADMANVWKHLSATKDMIPSRAAELPEAERAKFVDGYRVMMIDTLTKWLEVEKHYIKGDKAKAKEALDAFNATQTPGHKAYKD